MSILLGSLTALLIMILAVLGWSLVLGAVLALLLPFNLFEGALLAMLASGIGGYVFSRTPSPEDSDWDEIISSHEIPMERFFKTDAEKTWENWARFEIANAILFQFGNLEKSDRLSPVQREELAVRLSEPAVAILKRKTSRSAKLDVTVAQLANQLKRTDQQPYDDDIMQAAVDGINLALTAGPVEFAVRKKMWKQPAPILEVD